MFGGASACASQKVVVLLASVTYRVMTPHEVLERTVRPVPRTDLSLSQLQEKDKWFILQKTSLVDISRNETPQGLINELANNIINHQLLVM